MKRISLIAGLSVFFSIGQAQSLDLVKQMIDTLCSPQMHGRGYVSGGDSLAAEYLATECARIGLQPIAGQDYFQKFSFDVNTFPGKLALTADKTQLTPGADFIVAPDCPAVDSEFETIRLQEKWLVNGEVSPLFIKKCQGKLVLIDGRTEGEPFQKMISALSQNPLNAAGYLVLREKLTWSVGRSVASVPIVFTLKESALKAKKIRLKVDQNFKTGHVARNVIAMVEGENADSTIVFSAHYDHLGRMGTDTYIAGANDNASGTAMLLDIASSYVETPPKWNTVFIFFAGEEAGLVGSQHYVEQPFFPLEKIKFLINLDLMGDASAGITAVNGRVFEKSFELLRATNSDLEADSLLSIKARGKAANSDHYPFTELGVEGFFIYTRGEYNHYHDVDDVPENLPMHKYDQLFKLITGFAENL